MQACLRACMCNALLKGFLTFQLFLGGLDNKNQVSDHSMNGLTFINCYLTFYFLC